MSILAAYGTLRKGMGPFAKELASRHIGTDTIKGTMYSVFGHYPAVVEGTNDIIVDLFEITPVMWTSLDRYEGVPDLYQRVTTTTESGIEVFFYKWTDNTRELELIESGDWLNYLEM